MPSGGDVAAFAEDLHFRQRQRATPRQLDADVAAGRSLGILGRSAASSGGSCGASNGFTRSNAVLRMSGSKMNGIAPSTSTRPPGRGRCLAPDLVERLIGGGDGRPARAGARPPIRRSLRQLLESDRARALRSSARLSGQHPCRDDGAGLILLSTASRACLSSVVALLVLRSADSSLSVCVRVASASSGRSRIA